MTTAYSVGGTWAKWDQGFGADVCRILTHNDEWGPVLDEIVGATPDFRWQGIDYPGSFGPIMGPIDAQSYADSVTLGVDEGVRLINADPDPFILTGYSQGGEVVGRLNIELVEGRLQHRLDDCLGIVTFGDPTRQEADETIGGGKGWGISKLVIPKSKIPRRTYALVGDMYCTCPNGITGEQMNAVYIALTNIEIPLDKDLFSAIFGNAGLFLQVQRILEKPVTGGAALIDSLIRLAQFAVTGAHGGYGPHVLDAVHYLERLAA